MANNFVYFMKDPHTGLIKIGQSKNPEKRMKSIRTNHPGVTILATMEDHSLERELHDRFSHCLALECTPIIIDGRFGCGALAVVCVRNDDR